MDDHRDDPEDEGTEDEDKAEDKDEDARPDEDPLGGIDLSGLASKIDYSAFFPKIDYSAFMPKVDYSAFMPKVDLGPLFDTAAFAPKIDYSAFFSGINFSKLIEGLDLSQFSKAWPSNWPPDLDLAVAAEIVRDDGIPLVWVPRRTIVEELLAAEDRRARVSILLIHIESLVEDCRLVLDEVTDHDLAGQLPLARAAIDALANGHQESAQALATVVTETVVAAEVSANYKEVKDQVLFDVDSTSWHQLRLKAAFAPIDRFYTAWRREWGTPPPEALSRHVTVHLADTAHYTAANALLAVLLVTSVLRAVQELHEALDEPDDDRDVA